MIVESEAWQRIITDDADDLMPPPDSKLKLTAAQKAPLKAWVDAGAKWGKHWAYEPPRQPALPPVKNAKWPRNEIDNFILRRTPAANGKSTRKVTQKTINHS